MNIYQPGSFPKKCSCGAMYHSETDWRSLPFSCIWPAVDKGGKRHCHDMELRLCRCGSSIGVRILAQDPPDRIYQQERTGGNSLRHDKDGKSRYLLVVDSDVDDLFFTAMLLERFGYYLHIARTAREAFIAAATATPSLIITALDLSDLSGLHLIQLLKKNAGTLDIPFIILRRPSDLLKENQCFSAGAARCLNKPVSAEVLYQAVQIAIARGRE